MTSAQNHPVWVDLTNRYHEILRNRPEAPHPNARKIREAADLVKECNNKVWAHIAKGTTSNNWFHRHVANAHAALDRIEAEYEVSRQYKQRVSA